MLIFSQGGRGNYFKEELASEPRQDSRNESRFLQAIAAAGTAHSTAGEGRL